MGVDKLTLVPHNMVEVWLFKCRAAVDWGSCHEELHAELRIGLCEKTQMLHAKSTCTDFDCGTAFINTTSGLRKPQTYTNTLLSVATSGSVED